MYWEKNAPALPHTCHSIFALAPCELFWGPAKMSEFSRLKIINKNWRNRFTWCPWEPCLLFVGFSPCWAAAFVMSSTLKSLCLPICGFWMLCLLIGSCSDVLLSWQVVLRWLRLTKRTLWIRDEIRLSILGGPNQLQHFMRLTCAVQNAKIVLVTRFQGTKYWTAKLRIADKRKKLHQML